MRHEQTREAPCAPAVHCRPTWPLPLLLVAMIAAAPSLCGSHEWSTDPGYLTTGVLQRQPPDTCLVLVNFRQVPPALLDTYDGFDEGDTVVVTGDPPVNLPDLYCGVEFWIHRNHVYSYRGAVDLECGTLFEDDPADCYYFDSFRFGRFASGWSSPFSSGDTVHVTGVFLWDCRTWCELENPCVDPVHIVACSDTNPAVRPTSWGRLRALFR